MKLANVEAEWLDCEYVGTEHLLIALVKEGTGAGAKVIKNLGLDLHKIRTAVKDLAESDPEAVQRRKKAIEYSMAEALKLNHNYIGTEHILLGLLRDPKSAAAKIIAQLVSVLRLSEERFLFFGVTRRTDLPTHLIHQP